ncbi:hypothetical protein GC197_05575 [bacterium]|nr:hypothetical protein [bacterium]
MPAQKPTMVTFCLGIVILICGSPAVFAEPPAAQQPEELAVLQPLIGSWDFPVGDYAVKEEFKWTLDNQFLQFDAQAFGQSWRMLITYDPSINQYRLWKFSSNGEISTAQGTWNEKTSTLVLFGRSPDGNKTKISFEIDGDVLDFDDREFISKERMKVMGFNLYRANLNEDQQTE